MAKKYHITPRGEVKQCNAKVHCRYGDYNPHFDDQKQLNYLLIIISID